MNTNGVNASSNELTAEVRARVPKWMKDAICTEATPRILDEADILREALAEYLERRKKVAVPKPQEEAAA